MRKLFSFIVLLTALNPSGVAQKKSLTYLALGDSYTIGESVPIAESFPYQLVQMIRAKGIDIQAPEIVAKTGWTTAELLTGIANARLLPAYDYVTLLIGVNNQYRGLAPEEYAREFEQLLKMAIRFAGGNTSHVIVLSIPDWGATPFAKERNRAEITEQISDFNLRNSRIAARNDVKYVEITEGSREALINPELVAKDKLHPSGVEYRRWAEAVLKVMEF